jgi:hypothetical protein
LRVAAISCKNALFLGSDRGRETAAICLSILASTKQNFVEPVAYVCFLLESLAAGVADLKPLLPDAWINAHPEHIVQYRRDEADEAATRRAKHHED